MKSITIIVVVVVLILAGCSSSQPQKKIKIFAYQCGTTALTVTLDPKKDQVSFVMDGEQQVLPQVVAASGIKYSDGKYTFWSKGENAFIERRDKIIINDCVLIR